MPNRTYQEHLRATLNGNKSAFNQVVRMFAGMAQAVAFKRLKDPVLAEDAVQEAFLIAYARIETLNNLDAFPSWLRAILFSVCSKMRRKQEKYCDLHADGDTLPSPLPEPLEVVTRYQDRRMVLETLASLSGVARETCVLRYVQGMAYRDIADALSVPIGTVKRRLHDARAAFFKRMGANKQQSIRIGYLPISDHLLGMVAHSRHDQARYHMMLKRFLSWTALINALRNNVVDAAFMMAPLAMSLKNAGESILYILDGHHDGSAVAVAEEVARDRTLNGRRIGLPHATSTHAMILNTILASQESSGVHSRYIGPSYLIRSLKTREIDAFFCAEPWSTMSTMEGAGRILIRSKEILPGHLCCVLVVRTSFAVRRASLVKDCVKTLLDAGEFIAGHHKESARIQSLYTGVPATVAEQVLNRGDISFADLTPDEERTAATMSLAVRTGLLDFPCHLDSFVKDDFV